MALRSLGDVNGAMSQGTTFFGKFVPQYLSFHKLLYEKITTQTKQQNRNNVSVWVCIFSRSSRKQLEKCSLNFLHDDGHEFLLSRIWGTNWKFTPTWLDILIKSLTYLRCLSISTCYPITRMKYQVLSTWHCPFKYEKTHFKTGWRT